MPDNDTKSQGDGHEGETESKPACLLRRGAISVQSSSEFKQLQPVKNDKTKLLQYELGVAQDTAPEVGGPANPPELT